MRNTYPTQAGWSRLCVAVLPKLAHGPGAVERIAAHAAMFDGLTRGHTSNPTPYVVDGLEGLAVVGTYGRDDGKTIKATTKALTNMRANLGLRLPKVLAHALKTGALVVNTGTPWVKPSAKPTNAKAQRLVVASGIK